MKTLICDGKIYTMDNKNQVVEAVVYEDGEILYTGGKREAISKYGYMQEMDLRGNILLPGFIDSHCHISFTGEMLSLPNIFEIDSIEKCLKFFSNEAGKLSGDEALLINGFGGKGIKEKRFPTLEEMDRAVPNNVLICKTAGTHETLVNSKALDIIIEEASKNNIILNREEVNTGVLKNQANLLAFALSSEYMSDSQRKKARDKYIKECISNGIVSIHTLEGKVSKNDFDVYNLINDQKNLPFDVRIYYQTTNIDEVINLGLKQIGGCFGCLLDGDIDPGTAAMREPYYNDKKNYGQLYFSQEELNNFFKKANRKGLQICVHAIGDRAIEQALNAYEYALKDFPRDDHRHRIEHFEIADYDLIYKAKKLNICLAMQPVFDYYWPYKTYIPYIGEKRAKKRCMLKDILNNGIKVGGGSDAPVTSMNPFLSIHSAVNHSVENSSITVEQAIKLHTIDAAYIGFEDDIRGSIEVGKSADFVIISDNPFEINKNELDKIEIISTIFKGKTVWNKY